MKGRASLLASCKLAFYAGVAGLCLVVPLHALRERDPFAPAALLWAAIGATSLSTLGRLLADAAGFKLVPRSWLAAQLVCAAVVTAALQEAR